MIDHGANNLQAEDPMIDHGLAMIDHGPGNLAISHPKWAILVVQAILDI